MGNRIKGEVKKVIAGGSNPELDPGQLKPHSFEIQGEDGEAYFAHLGDIKVNEDRLYNDPDPEKSLSEGDTVEFRPVKNGLRAINITIIKKRGPKV